uniref:Uncharacterized protein n=1 Tax=Fagus sylvatica TaxID=28930 RepID=A0A2N9JBN6_FAGSY
MPDGHWTRLDRQVLGVIRLTMLRSVAHIVIKEKTTTNLMKAFSRASFQTTPHKEIIQNYVAGNFGKVYLADDETLDVVGMREIHIKMPNGSTWKIQKVQHIPSLKRNLISIGKLDEEGDAILFIGGIWKITKGAMVVARGRNIDTLFMTISPWERLAVANAGNDSSLWHYRLGHMSEKVMKVLSSKGKLPQLKSKFVPKSKKCTFIGYGSDEFGYRTSQKSNSSRIKSKKSELVNLDEYLESDLQSRDKEDQNKIAPQVEQQTPTTAVRSGKPKSYDKALQIEDSIKWELAVKDEMDSLMTNQIWEILKLPQWKKDLQNKWVYMIKEEHDVVRITTIGLVLRMVAAENMHLEQLYVKTTFLHGDLEEHTYMSQPQGCSDVVLDQKVVISKNIVFDEKSITKVFKKEKSQAADSSNNIGRSTVQVEIDELKSQSDEKPHSNDQEQDNTRSNKPECNKKPSVRYGFEDVVSYALLISSKDPSTFQEAIDNSENDK